jgi:glycosyltransferase involved in cell wall biosynthesis
MPSTKPLVSILSFCKNGASTIRRSVDSVLGQSYGHIEFVVQDGASTDGMLEILASYRDDRIRIVSEPDSGPAEAFWKVLNRCQGDIIGTCLSDEELLPDAVERAVELFRTHPGLGAATCNGYLTDTAGGHTGQFIAGEFNLVDYLFGHYCPFWPGTFFRRQALLDVGLEYHTWAVEALEFEVWCRLGTQHQVKYFPVLMSKYAVHEDQLSNTPKNFNEHMDNRALVIGRMFSETGFAGLDDRKKLACLYNQHYLFYSHTRAYRLYDQMEAIYDRMMVLLKDLDPEAWERQRAAPRNDALHALTPPLIPNTVYQDFANLYYARGQVRQALEMWERAGDPTSAALACQARLRLPATSHGQLLETQQHWATMHVHSPHTNQGPPWRPDQSDRMIRIGYYCSFMDADTIRFIMSAVIKRHDRKQFTVFGYSSTPVADDIADAFDTLRVTTDLSDQQFAELVRSDRIDIFVEMTGFSPYHRFGAMALRCAPIQISYLNHLGTSGVPNVDFILADAVSILPDEDRFFTERVWRLPGSFLCYNYDMVARPAVAPPPSRTNGFVTFGCFGSGGKINDDIIALWAGVLARVPGSRLYLRNHELTPQDNRQFMRDRFRRHGIPAERLRLDGGTSHDALVRSYDEVDISLDTWPYCGGNTIAESLWQGVPVVTLKGDRFVSRYGASLLLAAGCPELIGNTAEEYVEVAAVLAQSPERLDRYRANLRSMAREFGLSDADRFARKLDAAYVSMVQAHRSGRPVVENGTRVSSEPT